MSKTNKCDVVMARALLVTVKFSRDPDCFSQETAALKNQIRASDRAWILEIQ